MPFLTSFLLIIARSVAKTRDLVPYPGWHFDVDWTKPGLIYKVRRRIWHYCNKRNLDCRIVMRWYHGTRLNVYLGNDMSKQLFVAGCNEPNELAFVDRFLKPGMTFIDVGANDGLYTLLAAKKVSDSGRVLSFEPSQREYDRLMANVRLNRLENVEAFRTAIFSEDGSVELRVAGYENEGHNTLGQFVYAHTRFLRTETVAAESLDTIAQRLGLERLDLIKMDAEGAEFSILQGARQVISRFRPVVLMELNDPSLRQQGSSSDQIIETLKSLNYVIYNFGETTGHPTPAPDNAYSPDIVAAPAEHKPFTE